MVGQLSPGVRTMLAVGLLEMSFDFDPPRMLINRLILNRSEIGNQTWSPTILDSAADRVI